MPSLLDVQRSFAAGLLAETATTPSLACGPRLDPRAETATTPSLACGPRLDPRAETATTPSTRIDPRPDSLANAAIARDVRDGRFPAARLMQVYRNNVFENLTGALKAVYPTVERLVGAGFFAYVADAYIRRHPPTSGNLHDFGDAFPGFVAGFEPARELVYLPDVARLEWARHVAFHAADCAPLAVDRLATVSAEEYGRLQFKLHPSAQLVTSEYPLLRIWLTNQPGYAGDTAVHLAEGGVRLLVVRRVLEVTLETLGAGDYALLRAFAAGQCFDEASAAALAAQPDYDLPAALRRHVTSVVITDFSILGDTA